jgi:hypothetical protein
MRRKKSQTMHPTSLFQYFNGRWIDNFKGEDKVFKGGDPFGGERPD